MSKYVIGILVFLFTVGLSFHYDQSLFDFGEILLPNQFSIRSHLLFILSLFILSLFILLNRFKDLELTLFILLLIYLPSIYVYRFGIFDEIIISLFVFMVIIRDGVLNFKISKFNTLIIVFLFLSALIGLFYSIKSFRYVFQSFSILLLILYIGNNNSNFNQINTRGIISNIN